MNTIKELEKRIEDLEFKIDIYIMDNDEQNANTLDKIKVIDSTIALIRKAWRKYAVG